MFLGFKVVNFTNVDLGIFSCGKILKEKYVINMVKEIEYVDHEVIESSNIFVYSKSLV